jgi:hypothetical protein
VLLLWRHCLNSKKPRSSSTAAKIELLGSPCTQPDDRNCAAVTAPHTSAPHTSAPHTYAPHTSAPQTYTPHTYAPHTYTPHTYAPHTSTPSGDAIAAFNKRNSTNTQVSAAMLSSTSYQACISPPWEALAAAGSSKVGATLEGAEDVRTAVTPGKCQIECDRKAGW